MWIIFLSPFPKPRPMPPDIVLDIFGGESASLSDDCVSDGPGVNESLEGFDADPEPTSRFFVCQECVSTH